MQQLQDEMSWRDAMSLHLREQAEFLGPRVDIHYSFMLLLCCLLFLEI